MTDSDDFTARLARRRHAMAEAAAVNKAIILDALEAAGITAVTVAFDGEGDSGQLAEFSAYAGDDRLPIPATPLTIRALAWNSDVTAPIDTTLPEAMATLCYNCLAQEHDGWENNDGAYGWFVFDVPRRLLTLDFNARFVDSVNSMHNF